MSMSKDYAASRVIPIWMACAATQRYGAVWAELNDAWGLVWVHGPTAAVTSVLMSLACVTTRGHRRADPSELGTR